MTTKQRATKKAATRPDTDEAGPGAEANDDPGPGPDDAVNHVLIEGDPPVDDEETDQ